MKRDNDMSLNTTSANANERCASDEFRQKNESSYNLIDSQHKSNYMSLNKQIQCAYIRLNEDIDTNRKSSIKHIFDEFMSLLANVRYLACIVFLLKSSIEHLRTTYQCSRESHSK